MGNSVCATITVFAFTRRGIGEAMVPMWCTMWCSGHWVRATVAQAPGEGCGRHFSGGTSLVNTEAHASKRAHCWGRHCGCSRCVPPRGGRCAGHPTAGLRRRWGGLPGTRLHAHRGTGEGWCLGLVGLMAQPQALGGGREREGRKQQLHLCVELGLCAPLLTCAGMPVCRAVGDRRTAGNTNDQDDGESPPTPHRHTLTTTATTNTTTTTPGLG